MEGNYELAKRKYIIGGAAVIIILVYLLRLFTLQLLSEDFKISADSNAFLKRIQYPARGAITDRNGKLLVYNQPAYDVMVIMTEQIGIDTLDLCESLDITRDWYERRMAEIKDLNRNPGYSPYTQQLFMSQLSTEEFSRFQEKLFRFPGFYIQKRSIRQYSYPNAAHLLGDIGEVSPEDIEADPNHYYRSGDYIGKLGVERSYEEVLRGEKGMEVLLRDAGKLGSIVAIEPSTGEVLCMVSSPTYDPRIMIGRQRGKSQKLLAADPRKPLLNRAIMGQYPPGSTFKTSQALTFLQEGIITPQTAYPCSRGFRFRGLKVGCHGHGSPLPLVPAIATSCNGYFCWGLYHMFGNRTKYATVQDAMTTWKDYMVSMGFGYKLGIDLPGEKRGMIPNAPYYDKAYKEDWSGLTVISISIGQGEVNLTPLQIANLGATIANRGYYIIPHVVKEIQGMPLDTLYTKKRYTKVERKHYETVVAGMRQAVLGGTCRVANTSFYEVCGKTGTAQNPHGQDHSVFMGFAPRENPKIAICVYVENGTWGATYGVPIGALMMEQYINGKLSEASKARATQFENKHLYIPQEYSLQTLSNNASHAPETVKE